MGVRLLTEKYERVSFLRNIIVLCEWFFFTRWQDNTNLPAYRNSVMSFEESQHNRHTNKNSDKNRQNSRKKSIFEQEAVKLTPAVVNSETEVGFKIGLKEQDNIQTRHKRFKVMIYFVLINAIITGFRRKNNH